MKHYIIILISILALSAGAQEVLLLEDAMQTALANNLGIKMITKQQLQSENMVTYGNAGMMPTVNLNAGVNASKSNASYTQVSIPEPIKVSNIENESTSMNASLAASYTIFNGLGSINTYKKLQSQSDLAQIQTNLNIESVLLQVCNVYYEVARQQQQYEIAQNSLAISKERLERLEAGREYGVSTSLEVLNAMVDMNTDSSTVINNRIALSTAKRNLNMLLNRALDLDFLVSEELEINEALMLDEIKQQSLSNNVNLLLTQSNITVAELDEKIKQSSFLPKLTVGANYGYNYSKSSIGFFLNQSSLGLSGNLTLAWSLFDGFKKKSALENAKLVLETNQLKVEEAKQTVEKDVLNAFDAYQQNLIALKMEDKSVEAAQMNFDRSQELYKQGQITTTQFREAQLNLNRAESRKSNAQFVAKIAEIQLIRLKGELVK